MYTSKPGHIFGNHTGEVGLVFVDYQTQKRIMKDSAFWYRDMIQKNGEDL
ncbi:MAG: family 1 glycosylhydrolase [Lachnospiraceae bacterium]